MDRDPAFARSGSPGRRRASSQLRVLHLEDSELDHQLMVAQLRRSGLVVEAVRIETAEDYARAIDSPDDWDLIVSDYNLPGFSGMAALELLKARGGTLPFILVSGEIGEETAVEAMRYGASDYLLKNNLARLAPAMLHAIEAAQAEAARRRSDLELTQSKERLRALAQHLQTSVDNERAAIAREIHDDVGGALTALRFDLSWMARHAAGSSVGERALQALETVASAVEASQRIMHNLRPAILEQGLVAALQWMTSRFEKRTGVATVFRTSHETLQLPSMVPLVAYRFAQEALTNVSKHAQATRVGIDLALAGGVLSLEVSDDGRGLSNEDLAKDRSFGIRGLQERASTVDGWVDITSGPSGTTLILSVPLTEDAAGTTRVSAARERYDGDEVDGRHDPSSWGDL